MGMEIFILNKTIEVFDIRMSWFILHILNAANIMMAICLLHRKERK